MIASLFNLGGVAQELGSALGQTFLAALEYFANALIIAVGLAAHAVFLLLPDMPSLPSVSGGGWLGWLSFFLPVGDMLAGLAAFIVCWTGFLAVRIIGRWLKAL
jgi:hypothetical protein